MRSRSKILMEKSLAAMTAAIEVYNKPTFLYRPETFAILAVNAWELLLKARILQLNSNQLSSLLQRERRKKNDGSWSKVSYIKRNRAGNPTSIGLFRAFDELINEHGDTISESIRKNLESIVEIRDNAVHFVNRGLRLEVRIHEFAAACVRNYAALVRRWFGADLSQYNLFLIPVSFVQDFRITDVASMNADERRLLEFLEDSANMDNGNADRDFDVAVSVEISLKKASSTTSVGDVRVTNDPGAVPVRLDEEDVRQRYPWDYGILTKKLVDRYSDFKQNEDYHRLRQQLETKPSLCKERLLDPGNPRSASKRFYNPNIVREFDKHYSENK